MSESADFRKLEKKAYLSYHQDGLLDLVIGAVILGLGINEATDSSAWSLMAILLISAYVPLKRVITYPRLGYAKFNSKRGGVDTRLAGLVVAAALVLLLVGMLVLLRPDSSSSSPLVLAIRTSPMLLYGLLGCFGFGLGGFILGLGRLYAFALLSVVIMIGGHLLNLTLSVAFMLLGGAILATGAVLLVRFLRRNPIPEGQSHGAR